MYCQNRMVHTVQEGDSLYRLARQYHTTVTELILGNPGVNPYNLQVGMKLYVCPGESYVPPQGDSGNAGNSGSTGNTGNAGNSGSTGNAGISGTTGNAGMGGNTGNAGHSRSTGNAGMGGKNVIGEVIPGEQRPGGNQTAGEMQNSVNQLFEAMRLAWLELIYWTRMYMMSVDSGADAKEQYAVEGRLLETADAITDVFAERLPVAVTRQLRNLLVEHVEMTGQIIRTLKSGDMENYDRQIREWYANANQIATLLADQNPYFAGKETRNLLLNYLDMTREIIEHQMNGEYDQSIDTFRDLSDLVLELADYLARGLLAR